MSFEKKVLENFVQINYSDSTEEEKKRIIDSYEQRIAGKLKGEATDILVIYREDSKGFFGINKEGNIENM